MKNIPHKIWKIGDHYLDCGYIPRVVVDISYEAQFLEGVSNRKVTPDNYHLCSRRLKQEGLTGRSLIDGSIGNCSIRYCFPEWMNKIMAERWAKSGPWAKNMKNYIKCFYNSQWGGGRKIWWKE